MRRFVPLLLLLCLTAGAQTRVSRCYEVCNAYVRDARLRATSCGACLHQSDELHPWLRALDGVPPELLADDDWTVRWAALRELGRRDRSTGEAQLAGWLARSRGDELLRACLTAAHVVTPLPAACAARAAEVRSALEIELYSEAPSLRAGALTALSRSFGLPRARVVLNVAPTRPPEFDSILFDTLVQTSADGEAPVAQLMAAATPGDVAVMNRLLKLVSARRDAARALLEGDHAQRMEGIRTLRPLLPASEPELMSVLGFDDLPARAAAVRAIAGVEQRSVSRMAQARFTGERSATVEQQAALLGVLGDVHDEDCAAVALALWHRPGPLQLPSLRVAAFCAWPEAAPAVELALRDEDVSKRAAAVDALGFAPSTPQLRERLGFAASAKEVELRRAAARAIGAKRWRGGLPRIEALEADGDAAVRVEAFKAARALDAPGLEGRLARALATDTAPEVRATCAELLSFVGSLQARAALEAASKNEKDENVKIVVERALRRIR